MANYKEKLKTPMGELRYVTVTGEGRDTSMPGETASMNFLANVVLKKNSPELKAFKATLEKIWDAYKAVEPQAKGTITYGRMSKCAGIKDITVEVEDKNDIDPETDKVRRVDTDEVMVTFKTSTTWPDGKDKVVKKYANRKDAEGKLYAAEVTKLVDDATWTIGNGSTGILHGIVMGNTTGGKAKLTLLLTAVQLGNLVKYSGDVEDVQIDTNAEVTDFGEDDDVAPEEGVEV